MCKEQCCMLCGTCFSAMDYHCKNRYWWGWCERRHLKLDQCPEWPCACKAFYFPQNVCLAFNIIPSAETCARRADTGTSITLLSICDLPAPHPHSECEATMEESKGEGGRLRHYSGVCWKYTSSRIAHSIQATKVWENLLARCFTRGCCRWKWFRLLHWEKKNHNYKEGSWVNITLGYQFISPWVKALKKIFCVTAIILSDMYKCICKN